MNFANFFLLSLCLPFFLNTGAVASSNAITTEDSDIVVINGKGRTVVLKPPGGTILYDKHWARISTKDGDVSETLLGVPQEQILIPEEDRITLFKTSKKVLIREPSEKNTYGGLKRDQTKIFKKHCMDFDRSKGFTDGSPNRVEVSLSPPREEYEKDQKKPAFDVTVFYDNGKIFAAKQEQPEKEKGLVLKNPYGQLVLLYSAPEKLTTPEIFQRALEEVFDIPGLGNVCGSPARFFGPSYPLKLEEVQQTSLEQKHYRAGRPLSEKIYSIQALDHTAEDEYSLHSSMKNGTLFLTNGKEHWTHKIKGTNQQIIFKNGIVVELHNFKPTEEEMGPFVFNVIQMPNEKFDPWKESFYRFNKASRHRGPKKVVAFYNDPRTLSFCKTWAFEGFVSGFPKYVFVRLSKGNKVFDMIPVYHGPYYTYEWTQVRKDEAPFDIRVIYEDGRVFEALDQTPLRNGTLALKNPRGNLTFDYGKEIYSLNTREDFQKYLEKSLGIVGETETYTPLKTPFCSGSYDCQTFQFEVSEGTNLGVYSVDYDKETKTLSLGFEGEKWSQKIDPQEKKAFFKEVGITAHIKNPPSETYWGKFAFKVIPLPTNSKLNT